MHRITPTDWDDITPAVARLQRQHRPCVVWPSHTILCSNGGRRELRVSLLSLGALFPQCSFAGFFYEPGILCPNELQKESRLVFRPISFGSRGLPDFQILGKSFSATVGKAVRADFFRNKCKTRTPQATQGAAGSPGRHKSREEWNPLFHLSSIGDDSDDVNNGGLGQSSSRTSPQRQNVFDVCGNSCSLCTIFAIQAANIAREFIIPPHTMSHGVYIGCVYSTMVKRTRVSTLGHLPTMPMATLRSVRTCSGVLPRGKSCEAV